MTTRAKRSAKSSGIEALVGGDRDVLKHAVNGCRTRRGVRRGRYSRSAQYTRCTRLGFQGRPSTRSRSKHFQKTHRG